MTTIPFDDNLEGLYKLKIRELLVFTVHSATHLALSTIQFHAHNNNNNKELAL